MALAQKTIEDLAEEITSLSAPNKVKLLSRLMEAEGTRVDWSVVARVQRRHRDTQALRDAISATVRAVRRGRRQPTSR